MNTALVSGETEGGSCRSRNSSELVWCITEYITELRVAGKSAKITYEKNICLRPCWGDTARAPPRSRDYIGAGDDWGLLFSCDLQSMAVNPNNKQVG